MQDSFYRRLAWLDQSGNSRLILRGLRGIEKESLRVKADGRLSHSVHPFSLGSALTHPYLTTDYSEALLEFVTPPHPANWESLQFLCDLHTFVHHALDAELLWPASMPCVIAANEEIPIADYGPSNPGMMRTVYRRGLGHRYGRAMQAIAGTHFNFSPPEDLWPAYRDIEAADVPLRDFKSEQLMALVRNYRRYGWLIVYLFGASPALCKSFRPHGHDLLEELDRTTWYAPFATSLRMSDMGYRNKTQARLNVSVDSLDDYVKGLEAATSTVDPRYAAIGIEQDGEYRQLNANILQIENEYYTAIRPKPRRIGVRPIAALKRNGVEYVEVRTLDLNAVDPVGINQGQMRFLEAFLFYCLLKGSPPIDSREQKQIDARDLTVAREGRRPRLCLPRADGEVSLREWGLQIVDGVAPIATMLDRDQEGYTAAVEVSRQALLDSDCTPSARMLEELRQSSSSFFEFGLELAHSHHRYFMALDLQAERRSYFASLAEDSLREAQALASRPDLPFDAYLSRYFSGG